MTILLSTSAHAGLAYEFRCATTAVEQESSELTVRVSPDASQLIGLEFTGELNEEYAGEEIRQFKFDPEKRGELFVFVKSAEGKSGPTYFRLLVKPTRRGYAGVLEFLEMKDLVLKVAHTSKIKCALIP